MKPIRMCAACKKRSEKAQLFKLVRKDGQPVLDTAQKINGRSIYLCKDMACIKLAEKSKLLSRTFKVPCDELYQELKSAAQQD